MGKSSIKVIGDRLSVNGKDYPVKDEHRTHYVIYPVKCNDGQYRAADVGVNGYFDPSDNLAKVPFDTFQQCYEACAVHNNWMDFTDDEINAIISYSMGLKSETTIESELSGLYKGKGIITTFSGAEINVLDPKPEDFFLRDIAQGLSHTCRWNGQIKNFYSVAQHSIYVASLVPQEYKLQALMHDASEAFMNDISSPVKAELSNYKEIEFSFMKAISKRFGFEWPISPVVKRADIASLEAEYLCLRKGLNNNFRFKNPEAVYIEWIFRVSALLDKDILAIATHPRKEATHA